VLVVDGAEAVVGEERERLAAELQRVADKGAALVLAATSPEAVADLLPVPPAPHPAADDAEADAPHPRHADDPDPNDQGPNDRGPHDQDPHDDATLDSHLPT
jgi:hypothetical protein